MKAIPGAVAGYGLLIGAMTLVGGSFIGALWLMERIGEAVGHALPLPIL
jgi:hypothetical protein